jgi:hypothetical protein
MTKQELLADLATIFYGVLTPKLDSLNSDGDWNFYRVKVIDNIATDSVTDKVIGFRVYKEGDLAEEAYYVGRRPTAQDTSTTFKEEVHARLNTAIQNDQLDIKAGWIVRVDEGNEKVDVEVMRGTTTVTLQHAVVYRDGANLNFIWYTK